MLLQTRGDLAQLLIHLRHLAVQVHYGVRGADPGHDVFALGVGQVFAVELLVAGGRVAGEADAGRRVIAHIAEYHGLDVDGGAEVIGDLILFAVIDGSGLFQDLNTALRAFELLPGS